MTSCNGDFSLTKLEEVHISCRAVMSVEDEASESSSPWCNGGGCGEGEVEVIHSWCPDCEDQGVEVKEQVKKICQCSNERQLRHALGWTSTLTEMLEVRKKYRCIVELKGKGGFHPKLVCQRSHESQWRLKTPNHGYSFL